MYKILIKREAKGFFDELPAKSRGAHKKL